MNSKWQSIEIGVPHRIPSQPGVYVVISGGVAIYIGQSVNLRDRISKYRIRRGFNEDIITPWGNYRRKDGVTIKFKVSRRIGDWAMWEIRLIHKLKPEFNTTFAKMNRAA